MTDAQERERSLALWKQQSPEGRRKAHVSNTKLWSRTRVQYARLLEQQAEERRRGYGPGTQPYGGPYESCVLWIRGPGGSWQRRLRGSGVCAVTKDDESQPEEEEADSRCVRASDRWQLFDGPSGVNEAQQGPLRRTEIAKDGMDLPETFLNKRTTEEQSQPGVVCPSVPAGFSLTSQQISPDAAPWGGRAPEHQDQTRTQEFSSVSRSPPAASSEYPRLSPVKDQVTAPVGPKARDRPKLGGGPSGAGKLPPQEACWHCGSRDPDHLSELCPELPRNKLTAGICERPRCQKPRHPDYVTCWECRKYRRNTERYVLEATPPYIPPATGGATDGYGTGPNAHRSDYSTGQSAPPHPKRWYYVSASTTLPPGTYTYNSLRRHLESQGGWSATDRWSQGSYQGFVEAEPALKRTVQAGLRRPDGSLPVYYD